MKIKGEFVLRELVGETILVPVGRTALQLNGMITFLLFGPVRKLFFVQEDDE